MPNNKDDFNKARCSFCGKTQDQVRKMVAGPGVYICNECLLLCQEIVSDDVESVGSHGQIDIKTPKEIKEVLDQYVVGQESAKKALSVAVYNHYKRIQYQGSQASRKADVELQKSNIVMLGPTGCGKTYLAQTLAKILNVPFAIGDATSLTEGRLCRRGRGEHPPAPDPERGLRYRTCPARHHLHRRDRQDRPQERESLHHPRRQRRGCAAGAAQDPRRHHRQRPAAGRPQASASGFYPDRHHEHTVICGGAFDGIDKIIESRIGKKVMGFGAEVRGKSERTSDEIMAQLQPEDLLKFGLIPEFIGRLPMIVTLSPLDEEALIRILTEPKNALCRQYAKLLSFDNVELEFTPEALRAIAAKALERKSGARGLRAIIESVMTDTMYELPSMEGVKKCIITEDAVLKGEKPILIRGQITEKPKRKKEALPEAKPEGA